MSSVGRKSIEQQKSTLGTQSAVHPDPDLSMLFTACIRGDDAAWNHLVDRYGGLVWSVARENGLDPEDAADVFQYVWMELHRSLARIERPAALPRWLMVATRRQCYKVGARRRRTALSFDNSPSPDLMDPARLADDEVVLKENRRRLEEAIEQLSMKDGELIRLLFLDPENPSYEEISRRTGLAVGSIGPMRARCLRRLRKILEATP